MGSVNVKQRGLIPRHGPPATLETIELPQGHQNRPECRALPSAILFDQDQILTLRDGTKLRADVFRPKTDEKVPAIVMWGPYGKSGTGLLNLHTVPFRAGIPDGQLSGYEDFEGHDQDPFPQLGQREVDSEGDIHWWGTDEGRDGHDAIEEIAKFAWCTGKIGMAGNSWLAISQYFIAAEQPPHLACVAPLEGLSDPAREETFRGGIRNTIFSQSIAEIFSGREQQEDWCGMVKLQPISNDYYEDKRAKMSKIVVPAYIGARYSTDIRTIGSLRAFEEIPHDKKWLVLHSTQEWYDLDTKERVENDWLQTKPVRLLFLNYTIPALVNQEFEDLPWHLTQETSQLLYLSPEGELSSHKPSESGKMSYQADTPEKISLNYKFPSKTIITGPSTLFITVASPDHNDLDIYTHLFKADGNGEILTNLNIPVPDDVPADKLKQLTENRLFKYWGPSGCLRASRRHVDPRNSGKTWKTLSYEKFEPVAPGETVRLEIQLWPTGTVFEAGEQLILKISGEPIGVPALPYLAGHQNANKGKHVLHVGGQDESYLQFYTI